MAAPGPVGPYWFRERSGMPLIQLTPLSGRSLSFSEREIALLRAQQVPVREIARQLARAPSTISRRLRRNAASGGPLGCRAGIAQWEDVFSYNARPCPSDRVDTPPRR